MQPAVNAYREGQTAAAGAFAPLSALGQNYGRAVGSYYDALGLNGPEGVTRAQGQFTTSPGYQFAVDEATKAAANRAASLGIAGTGNTLDEIRNRAQGFAKQDYGSYLDRLAGFVNPQLAATTAAAQGGANAALTTAGQIGGAYTGTGGGLANIYRGTGQDVANVFGNVAQGQTGVLRDVTGGNVQANNLVAQAGMQDASNFWNLLGNLGGAAAKAAFPGKP